MSITSIAESWPTGLKRKDFTGVPLASTATFQSPLTGKQLRGALTIRKFLADHVFPITKDTKLGSSVASGERVTLFWDFATTIGPVVPIAETFRIKAGKIVEARAYFDPTPIQDAKRARLKQITEAYFAGIAKHDMSAVPYHDKVVLRSPLGPGGLAEPMRGRAAVIAWFESLWPVLGKTKVWEQYFNEDLTMVAARADLQMTKPPSVLRVFDRFRIDAQGRIVEQENHYDPDGGPATLHSAF